MNQDEIDRIVDVAEYVADSMNRLADAIRDALKEVQESQRGEDDER